MADTKKISFDTTILQMGNNTGICVPVEVVEELGQEKSRP